MTDFIRYGKFDTLEHAKNGLKGPDSDKIAKARVQLYKVHQKAKELSGVPIKKRKGISK